MAVSAGKVTTYVVGRELRNLVKWWLPSVGHKGLAVYVYVAHRSNEKKRTGCFESVEKMSRALGIGRNSVRNLLHELVRHGLLTVEAARWQDPNTYRPVLPVPQPSGLPELVGLTESQGLTNPVGLNASGLTDLTSQASRNRATNRRESTESDTGRVRAHLYEVLERMNGTPPTPSYGRDGKQARRHVDAHGVDHVLEIIDAFPTFWPTYWKGQRGEHPTVTDFWGCFDKIPSRRSRAPSGTPLSKLSKGDA